MYSAGTAYLTVTPSFLGIQEAFEDELKKIGKKLDDTLGKAGGDGLREAAKEARKEGERAGENYGSAFAAAVRRPIEKALRDLPEFEIDVDSSDAERAVAELREDLKTLRDVKIGVDLQEEEFFAEIERMRATAKALEEDGLTVDLRFNAKAAGAELEKILDVARSVGGQGTEDGQSYGGAWAEAVKRRLTAARKAIGEFQVDVDLGDVEQELLDLRTRLDRLSEQKIDVDIPSSGYLSELAELETALQAIADRDVNINLRTNARQAAAEIQALRQMVTGEDNSSKQGAKEGADFGGAFATAARNAIRAGLVALPEVELNADSSDIDQEIAKLRTELVALSNVEIGVDMDGAAAYAEINRIIARLRELAAEDPRIDVHSNLLATAAELGAVQTMVNRLDGQDIDINVDVDAGAASLRLLAAEAGISLSRLGILISVGAAVGTAIVPAAAAAAASVSAIATAAAAAVAGIGVLALSLFGVVKAVQALNAFQKASTKSSVSLGAANDRVANALDTVRNSQRGLARAERERIDAVNALSKAQEEARRQLEDMALAVKSNALAQRQARLDEAEAKEELDRLIANPRATEAEREQARITYEQRVLQLDELAVQQKRLAADKAEADRKGVANSDKVLAAQQRIADATESLVRAQESLGQSQRALAAAYEKTGVAGGEALSNLQQAMDALSPAGKRFALFIFGLQDDFKRIQGAAEGGLLPGLETAIRNLLPYMPQLEKFVGIVAEALGEAFVTLSEKLKDPIWQRFFGYLADTAGPVLKGMFTFAENVARGLVGILLGLSGFNGSIGDGLLKWAEGFAEWGENLDKNEGWQKFLDYVKQAAPAVIEMFERIWDFTKKFVIAAAPIGLVVVKAFSELFGWLDKIDSDTWTVIIAAIGGVALALLAVSAATAIVAGGATLLVIGAIAAIGAAFVLLYQKVKPFRDAVDLTVAAVQVAFAYLTENVIKPAVAGIGILLENLKSKFSDLYEQVFVHIFGLIKTVFEGFVNTGKTLIDEIVGNGGLERLKTIFVFVFGLLQKSLSAAGDTFSWLWDHVIKPVLGFIGVGFGILQAIFGVAFGLIQIQLKALGAAWRWFYDHAIQPVIDLLKPVFNYLAEVIDKHVKPPFQAGLRELGKAWDLLVEATKAPIKFIVSTILNDGLLAGYNQLAKTFGVKPDDVKITLPSGFAVGGAVYGPGTSTSDSIPARLSRGEHVWTAAEVEAAGGHQMVYAMRRMVLDGGAPGFARGGAVGGTGDGLGDFFTSLKGRASKIFEGVTDLLTDPAGALKRLAEQLYALIPGRETPFVRTVLGLPGKTVTFLVDKVAEFFGTGTGGVGGQIGGAGLGWAKQMDILRAAFPGLQLYSGFRPNSFTASGSLSWHSRDGGRAVDIPPRMDVFDFIYKNFKAGTKELIWLGDPARNIQNGQNHRYSDALLAEHGTQGMSNAHIHWAYDQGGWLPPGYSTVYNGTGAPEPVLTSNQWRDINALARGGDGAVGSTYNFAFRDTTLDPGRFRAMQDREAAMARQGRAR